MAHSKRKRQSRVSNALYIAKWAIGNTCKNKRKEMIGLFLTYGVYECSTGTIVNGKTTPPF